MDLLDENLKIEGFDDETQHAFDKLAAYYAISKTRMNPRNLRYVTKLNQFQLRFMEYLDKADNKQAKAAIQQFITEIQQLIQNASAEPAEKKPRKRKPTMKTDDATRYANPNNGGEYWDGGIHIYEIPDDEA